MKLMFKPGNDSGIGVLFLTKGNIENENENFLILAEMEFWDLSTEDQDYFEEFIKEANEHL